MDRGTPTLFTSNAVGVLQPHCLSQGHSCIWRARRPRHKPQSASSADTDPRGKASAGPVFALLGAGWERGAE